MHKSSNLSRAVLWFPHRAVDHVWALPLSTSIKTTWLPHTSSQKQACNSCFREYSKQTECLSFTHAAFLKSTRNGFCIAYLFWQLSGPCLKVYQASYSYTVGSYFRNASGGFNAAFRRDVKKTVLVTQPQRKVNPAALRLNENASGSGASGGWREVYSGRRNENKKQVMMQRMFFRPRSQREVLQDV